VGGQSCDSSVSEVVESAVMLNSSGFGALVVSMLASGTQDRGFKLGRSHLIFFGHIKS
jgi:hypothetical protein